MNLKFNVLDSKAESNISYGPIVCHAELWCEYRLMEKRLSFICVVKFNNNNISMNLVKMKTEYGMPI